MTKLILKFRSINSKYEDEFRRVFKDLLEKGYLPCTVKSDTDMFDDFGFEIYSQKIEERLKEYSYGTYLETEDGKFVFMGKYNKNSRTTGVITIGAGVMSHPYNFPEEVSPYGDGSFSAITEGVEFLVYPHTEKLIELMDSQIIAEPQKYIAIILDRKSITTNSVDIDRYNLSQIDRLKANESVKVFYADKYKHHTEVKKYALDVNYSRIIVLTDDLDELKSFNPNSNQFGVYVDEFMSTRVMDRINQLIR